MLKAKQEKKKSGEIAKPEKSDKSEKHEKPDKSEKGGKLERPSLTFLSDYGYVQVAKEEYENGENLVHFAGHKNKLIGRIDKSHLSREIKVNLKTLYGDRHLHTYMVKIDDNISSLVKSLIQDEEKLEDPKKKWNKNYQYRLISTVGQIKELTPGRNFIEENVKSNHTLILASPMKLNFSEQQHGPGILIENNLSTAYKQNGDEHQYALTDKGYSCGTNYIEFTLETEPDERNIIIGVTHSRNDYYFNSDCRNFWGFVPSDCKKIYNDNGNVQNVDYGDICKMGDKVGILLEFTTKGLDVSFFVNKLDLGVAFRGLPLNTYYPCVLLYYDGAKVKVTNRVPLPENKV